MSAPARPELRGRRVVLDPLRDRHVAALHTIATADELLGGWPCYGRALSLAEFRQSIWQLGGLQFAVRRRDDDRVIGVVQGIDPDVEAGVVDVAFFVRPDLWLSGWPFEAVVLLLDYLFMEREFRKVYFRVQESDAAHIGLNERWATEEARYTRHHLDSAGSAEDVVFLAMDREAWDTDLADRILGRARIEPLSQSPVITG